MKNKKEISAQELTPMTLNDFKDLMVEYSLVIQVRGKKLCRVVEKAKENDEMLVINYADFTRGKKTKVVSHLKGEKAVVKLVTNAHRQKVCYLIP